MDVHIALFNNLSESLGPFIREFRTDIISSNF